MTTYQIKRVSQYSLKNIINSRKNEVFSQSLINAGNSLSSITNHVYSPLSVDQKEGSGSKLQLLTSSMDKTLIIWESDESSDVWLEVVRLGEVGGNTLGFRGGKFGPNGDFILAYSYHGAFHVWRSAEVSQSMKEAYPSIFCKIYIYL